MLPNSSASKDGPVLPKRVSSATPSAKEAVVTDADRGVGADAAAAGDGVDGERGRQPPQPGPSTIGQPDERGGGVAAEDRVRQAVADVAHAAQDDEDPDEAAQAPGEDGGDQPLTKNS
jgi:hypothetical protein